MADHKKDMLCGATFAILGIILLFGVECFIPKSVSQSDQIGPDGVPRMIALLMLSLSLFLMTISAFKMKKDKLNQVKKEKGAAEYSWNTNLVVGIFICLLIAYSIVIDKLGFLFATFGFTTLLLALMKIKKWWWYLICYGFSFVVYYVFSLVLKVALP